MTAATDGLSRTCLGTLQLPLRRTRDGADGFGAQPRRQRGAERRRWRDSARLPTDPTAPVPAPTLHRRIHFMNSRGGGGSETREPPWRNRVAYRSQRVLTHHAVRRSARRPGFASASGIHEMNSPKKRGRRHGRCGVGGQARQIDRPFVICAALAARLSTESTSAAARSAHRCSPRGP